MNSYEKPITMSSEGLSEGVFASSGDVVDGCDGIDILNISDGGTCKSYEGRWKVQVSWSHHLHSHSTKGDILHFAFNKPVTFYNYWNDCTVLSGDGTADLEIQYNDHALGNVGEDFHFICDSQPVLLSVNIRHGH